MAIGDGWDVPEEAAPWSDFHWFQVSPKESKTFAVLSEAPVWYTGHYHKGRMRPCPGEGCELCAEGVGAQVRYCFSVVDVETRRVGLIELGRGHGMELQEWSGGNGGLKGLQFEAHKDGKASQSRTVLCYIDQVAPDWVSGVEGPEVRLALFLTWDKAGFPVPEGLRSQYRRRPSQGKTRRSSYT